MSMTVFLGNAAILDHFGNRFPDLHLEALVLWTRWRLDGERNARSREIVINRLF